MQRYRNLWLERGVGHTPLDLNRRRHRTWYQPSQLLLWGIVMPWSLMGIAWFVRRFW